MPDKSTPPPNDGEAADRDTHAWSFPPIEPVADDLLGWTPEPAVAETPMSYLPAAAETPMSYLPAAAETPMSHLPAAAEPPMSYLPAAAPAPAPAPEPPTGLPPEPVTLPSYPPPTAAAEPVVTEPVVAVEPAAAPEPNVPDPLSPEPNVPDPLSPELPSAGVLPVPRRRALGDSPVSPLRALAGAAVAVAGVLLGIGALLWATDAPSGSPTVQQAQSSHVVASPSPEVSIAPSPKLAATAPAPVVRTAPSSPAAAPKLELTILNNSKRQGLAKRTALTYQAAGWPIRLVGSFRGRIPVTTVYYAPGQQASAVALQRAFPAIERVRPRFAGLPGSGLTVVLTRTYPG